MSHTLTCYIEAPSPHGMAIKADLHADFYEDGGESPTSIIKSNQNSHVDVTIDFSTCGSALANALCLRWCVKLAFEGCGSAVEGFRPVVWVDQTVCKDQSVTVTIPIPAGTLNAPEGGGCGDVYGLCVTAVAFTTCGTPLPFAGFCKGGTIMVFPAD